MSLADSYDIEGSIAGVEELLSQDVSLVHEMGNTIFSERLSGRMVNFETAAIGQSTAFVGGFVTDLEVPVMRILGVEVMVDTVDRVADMCVSISQGAGTVGNEMPIWVFAGGSNYRTVRFLVDGTLANQNVADPVPAFTKLPNILVGRPQPETTSIMNVRGTTTAFGAGDVTITVAVYLAFPQGQALSSRGLPVPSW